MYVHELSRQYVYSYHMCVCIFSVFLTSCKYRNNLRKINILSIISSFLLVFYYFCINKTNNNK